MRNAAVIREALTSGLSVDEVARRYSIFKSQVVEIQKRNPPGPKRRTPTEGQLEIIALWNSGLTAAEIGKKAGRTRSGVLSVVHRFQRRGVDVRKGSLSSLKPKAVRVRAPRKPKATVLRAAPAVKLIPIAAPPPPKTEFVSTVEATEHVQAVDGCRYPIGNPRETGFHFCGNDRGDSVSFFGGGRPYCDFHTALTRQKPATKTTGGSGFDHSYTVARARV